MEDRDDYIHQCFVKGWRYVEIQAALSMQMGVNISLRHLKHILASLGLYRRKNRSDINEVINFITEQVNTVGQLHGYRFMTQKCSLAGISVSREVVRNIIKIIDPEGVNLRKRNHLIRWRYYGRGPNNIWHIDGYDKLKPFGIPLVEQWMDFQGTSYGWKPTTQIMTQLL